MVHEQTTSTDKDKMAYFLMSLTCPTDVVEVAASLAVNPIFYKE